MTDTRIVTSTYRYKRPPRKRSRFYWRGRRSRDVSAATAKWARCKSLDDVARRHVRLGAASTSSHQSDRRCTEDRAVPRLADPFGRAATAVAWRSGGGRARSGVS